MKAKTTAGRIALLAVAVLAFGPGRAQNSSYDADNIPLLGGSNNAAFGGSSMSSNTGGWANAAIGWYSLQSNVNGGANTACGYGALANNDADFNTALGTKCMDGNTTGKNNTAGGCYALNVNQNGNDNSAFGYQANVSMNGLTNASAFGANAIVNNSNRVWIGDMTCDVWCATNFWGSDERFKRNITADKVKGLSFIKLLRPVTYNFDGKAFTEHVTSKMPADVRKGYTDKDFSKSYGVLQTGFIAQEVETAAKATGYDFSGLHVPEGETDTYGLSYYQFVVPLVKGMQEQQDMIESQSAMIEKLQQQIALQQRSIDMLMTKPANATGFIQPGGNSAFAMEQNVPNPFTHETVIKYNLPATVSSAYMGVYDLSGKQVATFPLTQKGNAAITLNSDKLASGIYIYSIVADGNVVDSKRMIVADK